MAYPELSAARLIREIRKLGYTGAYTAARRHRWTCREVASRYLSRRSESAGAE